MIHYNDLNINLLTDSYDKKSLLSTLDTLNLHLVPYNATHHTSYSDTWLDVHIVDDINKIGSSGQSEIPFLFGHDLISLSFDFYPFKYSQPIVTKRKLTSLTYEALADDLNAADWNQIFESTTVDEKVDKLTEILCLILDIHAPAKMFKVRRLPAPWLSTEIKSMMKERDKIRLAYKRSRIPYI